MKSYLKFLSKLQEHLCARSGEPHSLPCNLSFEMMNMWSQFNRYKQISKFGSIFGTFVGFQKSSSRIISASVVGVSATLFLSGAIIGNDSSTQSLNGVDVDSAIDPFKTRLSSKELPFLKTDHKLIASGVRSVTFVGFKVYGVGLYISAKHEKKLNNILKRILAENPDKTILSILNDKGLSQKAVDEISQEVPYAVKITPIRNTDFGHLKDGLTKSILANPMAKNHREEVALGVEELRNVFLGFRGSFPKNSDLWVVSDTKNIRMYHNIKGGEFMGTIVEPMIARVLLVSYLSSIQPLSEPLRKNFVGYASSEL